MKHKALMYLHWNVGVAYINKDGLLRIETVRIYGYTEDLGLNIPTPRGAIRVHSKRKGLCVCVKWWLASIIYMYVNM